jgi:hypothetical protein
MKPLLFSFLFSLILTSVKSQLIEPKITFSGIDTIQLGLPRVFFNENFKEQNSLHPKNKKFANTLYCYRKSIDSSSLIKIAGINFKIQNLQFNMAQDTALFGMSFINIYGHNLDVNRFTEIQQDVEKLKTYIVKQIGKMPKKLKRNYHKGSVDERIVWQQKKVQIIIQFQYTIPDFSQVALSLYIGEIID